MKKTHRWDIYVGLFLFLFSPIFVYNLGTYSLVAFDEAWFAEVARNIVRSGNPFLLTFNNAAFVEHPPFGFILIALSFLLFGVSDFAARFPAAILGWGSVYLTYLIGKKISNWIVGLGASFILLSCVWFVFRARSGNLDTPFLFFYLLSFYATLRVKENSKWLFVLAVSFALMFLTKMLIGVTLLIPITAVFLLDRPKIQLKHLVAAVLLVLLIIAPWIIENFRLAGVRFLTHSAYVGFRPFARRMPNLWDLGNSLTFQYLHFGIGKWYKIALIASVGSLPFILRNKLLIPIYLLLVVLFTGFLTNEKTEIWHLIPVYPFLALLIAFLTYKIVTLVFHRSVLIALFTLFLIGSVALYQMYQFRNQIKLHDFDQEGLAKTAKAAQHRPEKLFLYADYFLPSAVFYSQKHVDFVGGEPYPANSLVGLIDFGQKPFLLLTEKWKLDLDRVSTSKYTLLKKYKEYVLILVN